MLARFTMKKIDDAIQKIESGAKADPPSLLQCLLSEPTLTRDQVLVLVNDLLTGGVDSVSTTSSVC